MLRFRYAKANSHRFVSDLQTKTQASSAIGSIRTHLDGENHTSLSAGGSKTESEWPISPLISCFWTRCITCLTSWMRDSTCVFTFARAPVTPLTLTCDGQAGWTNVTGKFRSKLDFGQSKVWIVQWKLSLTRYTNPSEAFVISSILSAGVDGVVSRTCIQPLILHVRQTLSLYFSVPAVPP